MTLNAEYQRELQKTYIVGKSVPELVDVAQKLLEQIRDPDEFLPIRLDALIMVARTLEAKHQKFMGPELPRYDLARRWLDRDKDKEAHGCGPLCPEHGDPRDTGIDPLPFSVGHNIDKGLPVTRHATLKEAEDRIEQIQHHDPVGVARGDYYIDGPEELINGR